MNADGSNQTRLTNNTASDANPVWSPDGTKIAFESNQGSGTAEDDIYTMNADGTNQTRLTTNPYNDAEPSWSPDGTKIAFSTNRDGNYDVYTMNADGTNQTRLTINDVFDAEPAWSPSGTKIAFGTYRDGNWEIEAMNADGTSPTRLTNNPAIDLEPDWAPVVGNRPPDCSGVVANPSVLLNPRGDFRLVTLSGATDPDNDPVTLTITGVTQDEPLTGPGDRTSPDAAAGDASYDVQLRAERSSRGDGRVYRVAFDAADGFGATCSGVAKVGVPLRKGSTAIDSAPPSYNSFGG
jgi:dipeptidyl aminopeptidase/acylaminoacyl peptidase